MNTSIQELADRINAAKRFLDSELTNLRLGRSVQISAFEIHTHRDTIHEVERQGLRNISELELIRIQRTLTTLEAQMSLSNN
jgi:hypothetical protein